MVPKPPGINNLLLVDESYATGTQMNQAIKTLSGKHFRITKAVLILTNKERAGDIDYYYKLIPGPVMFEWAIGHQKGSWEKIAFDLDGVICEDCPPGVDLNDVEYRKWLEQAKPFLIPSYTIDVIISSRLEKYREPTTAWLNAHEVKYSKLILWNIPSKGERAGQWLNYKLKMLKQEMPDAMYESDNELASELHRKTGIPILSISQQ